MSYAEDMCIDAYDEDSIYNRGYWINVYGKQFKIKEMDTAYIKNCINFLKRKSEDDEDMMDYVKYKLEELQTELIRRNEY